MEPTALASRDTSKHLGWYDADHLPHWDVPGVIQHVTYHLADSLPRAALLRIQEELRLCPERCRSATRRKRLQDLLDVGLGSCVLRHDKCAEIVENSFLFGHGKRYHLIAWVVMPNHIHVLIKEREGWPLGKVIQSWKRHTAREINRLNPSSSTTRSSQGKLWQRNYWDRYIRDNDHLENAIRYIEWNPVKAGLVANPEDWCWSSARLRTPTDELNSLVHFAHVFTAVE